MAEVRVNLLLMGKTGVGKSACGNTILGMKCFKEFTTLTTGSKNVSFNMARFEGNTVYVVDPPGLMDAETIAEERAERAGADMFEALIWCGGEVDAFVLVIRYGTRFSQDDMNSLEMLKIIFGENYFNHLIVVVTHGDSFPGDMEHEGTPDKGFDTWRDEQRGPFRQLLTDCNGRFVLFNNREKDEGKMRAQRQKLIQLAKDLQRNNGKYTSESFEDAKELRDRFILEMKAPLLQKNILAIISLLVTDIQTLTDASPVGELELEHIKQGIEDLQNELQLADKTTGYYQPLMENVAKLQQYLHNIEELHRLAQELHAAKVAEKERMEILARDAYSTFLARRPSVKLAAGVVWDLLKEIIFKIYNDWRFKRICRKIVAVIDKSRGLNPNP